jgi:hypothetical protein
MLENDSCQLSRTGVDQNGLCIVLGVNRLSGRLILNEQPKL